jgi:pilus assembly protein FimV
MTYKTRNKFGWRASVVAMASGLTLLAAADASQAAGLGKVVVQSALGQPLRAEIEVTATRDELTDMKAQLASPEAFKQAGLDYATTLLGIRFSLDKRAGGQTVIRLTSDKPINDPFVDMLLELSWPTGRLVREYTFLLDPPEVAAKAAAPVATPTARPATPSRAAAIDEETRGRATARVRVGEETSTAAAAKPGQAAQETREVRRGDTLNKIANEVKYDGVTLDQMLVGLLRANQDAFDGGNMNRLKAGRILSVPDKATIEALSASEARRIVIAQSSDWNAYRSKLAGIAAQSPGRESTGAQESAGKITAKVDDRTAPAAEARDQLKVAPTEKASGKPGAADKRGEEDLIAKDKALDEARQRLAALEKNVSDLQKLVELKNQSLAELQTQLNAKAATGETAKPGPQPETTPKTESTQQPESKPQAESKPESAAAAPTVPPAAEVKPAEAAPAPKPAAPPLKPKVVAPPPPPPEEPTLLEEMLDNPLPLAGGGGVLALLAAWLVVRRRRAARGEVPLSLGNSLSQQFSSLTANSIFRSTGGQSVDTSHGPAHTDFSQAGPGSIDTDEVDPVAEADVYMAYGRDAQAEEILIEARQKDPTRHAIVLKLLEIYANRKDVAAFEALAGELYGETGGNGAEWEKAAALGQMIDPDNPLYRTPQAPVTIAPPIAAPAEAVAPLAAAAALAVDQTVSLPGELSQLADLATAASAEAPAAKAGEPPAEPLADEPPMAQVDLSSLDFDLGATDDKMPAAAEPPMAGAESEAQTEPESAPISEPMPIPAPGAALDFDLAADSASLAAAAQPPDLGIDFELPAPAESPAVPPPSAALPADASAGSDLGALDFDLVLEPLEPLEPVAPDNAVPAATAPAEHGEPDELAAESAARGAPREGLDVQFDADMTDSTFLGRSMPDASSFDLSAIDLDLEAPEPPQASASLAPAATQSGDFTGDSAFESLQETTAVGAQAFDLEQQETLISPQRLAEVADLGEDEFTLQQGRTNVNPQLGAESDAFEAAATTDAVSNEDVATKLDLAKAYEEMGDYEGARELLQEVLAEGDAAQRAKAQFILAKIGD